MLHKMQDLVQQGNVVVMEQQYISTGLVSAMLSSLHLRWQTCVLLLKSSSAHAKCSAHP